MALVIYFAYKNFKNNKDFFEVFIRHNRLQKRKTKKKENKNLNTLA